MKKEIYLFTLLLTFRICDAQNLVLNGDFEQYYNCPSGYDQMNSAKYWYKATTGGTSDYLNQCAPSLSNVSIPVNFDCSSYQLPHSGNGYAAFINFSGNIFYREYIEGSLSTPLTAGVTYTFEMYLSLVNCSKFAADGLGVYFSNSTITGINTNDTIPYTPQISNPNQNYFTDTTNWMLFSAPYTAQGGEQYFIIGNFKNDQNTYRIVVNNAWFYNNCFYYVDDVSLSVSTGINEQKKNPINIFPNPVTNNLNITVNDNDLSEIILYDIASRKIMQKKFINTVSLNTEQLAKGIYIYEVRDRNGLCKKGKVVKE